MPLNFHDDEYSRLCTKILHSGADHDDRTGVGTFSLFGQSMRFSTTYSFPLLTRKKITFKGVFDELKWFYSGSTDVNDIPNHIKHWWTPFSDETGDLGHTYGKNLRCFPDPESCDIKIDQLSELFESLTNTPNSRRHIMSTWNAGSIPNLTLPSCHGLVIQFKVQGNTLHLSTYQRSADVFLGLPINIAHYALLLHMVSYSVGLRPGDLFYALGDCHIYSNHVEQVMEQLRRSSFAAPTLKIVAKKYEDPLETFMNISYDDLVLENYQYHPPIKGDMAV